MTLFSIIFLTLLATLFLAAVVRWLCTPSAAPERQERSDLVCLLFLIVLGQGGTMARDRFAIGSRGFWLGNILLIMVCGFAFYYIRRLFSAYRGAPPPAPKSTARVLKPPKIDIPKPNKGSKKQ